MRGRRLEAQHPSTHKDTPVGSVLDALDDMVAWLRSKTVWRMREQQTENSITYSDVHVFTYLISSCSVGGVVFVFKL